MDTTSTDRLIEEACNGNRDAEVFLRVYLKLAHQIDDCVDCAPTKEQLLQTFLTLLSFATMNRFYQQFKEQLYPLLATALSAYATSVGWENSQADNERRMSDHLRSHGASVIEFVALLCGGIERMRTLSPLIWQDSWKCHHSKEGNPT